MKINANQFISNVESVRNKIIVDLRFLLMIVLVIGFTSKVVSQTCVSDRLTYSVDIPSSGPGGPAPGGGTVSWTITPTSGYQNKSVSNDGVKSYLTVTWTVKGSYQVVAKDLSDNSVLKTITVNVQGASGGTLVAQEGNNLCSEGTINFTVSGYSGSSFQLQNLTTGQTYNGTSFNNIYVSETSEFRFKANPPSYCSSPAAYSNTVMVEVIDYSPGLVSIASQGELCDGNNETLTVTVGGAHPDLYLFEVRWRYAGGSWKVIGLPAFEDPYTAEFVANNDVEVYAVMKSGECTYNTPTEQRVFYGPQSANVSQINGPSQVCSNTPIELSITSNANSIEWRKIVNGNTSGILSTGTTFTDSQGLSAVSATYQVTSKFTGPCSPLDIVRTHTVGIIEEDPGVISIGKGSIFIGESIVPAYFGEANFMNFEISKAGEENWIPFSEFYTLEEVGYYEVRAKVNLICSGMVRTPRVNLQVNHIDPLTPGSIGGNTTICEGDYANLGVEPAEGGSGFYSYTWQKEINGEWEDIATGGQFYLTKTAGTYRREVTSKHLTEYSNTVEVTVLPNFGGSIYGNTVRFQSGIATYSLIGNTGTILRWKIKYRDDLYSTWSTWDITETNKQKISFDLEKNSGGYRYYQIVAEVRTNSCPIEYPTLDVIVKDVGMNYIHSYTPKIEVNQDVISANDPAEVSESISYIDGLGRKNLDVIRQASSLLSLDIAQPTRYDRFGRISKKYLPYIREVSDGTFDEYAIVNQHNFYSSMYGNDGDFAFSETKFINSPISQPIEQGGPGEVWQIGQQSLIYDYQIDAQDEVILWKFESLLATPIAHYGSEPLYKTTTTDEDEHVTIEYTDKSGQVILKSSDVGDGQQARTYYIYDDFGRLRVVLPPEATDRLTAEFFAPGSDRQQFLDRWAFQYTYDDRGRMTEKKVPGAEKVLMVYDKWDRLVLTQDGNQRNDNQWLFTKYDQLNRPVMTGIVNDRVELISEVEDDARNNRAETMLGTGYLPETQYTDTSYPLDADISEYHTITYYDNYDFVSASDLSDTIYSCPDEFKGVNVDAYHLLPELQEQVKGQVTGSKTKILGTPDYLETITYYDDRYRVIQVVSENHLGGVDIISNQYDFVGNVRRMKSVHTEGTNTTTMLLDYAYDHANRLLSCTHQLNAEPPLLLYSNEYNELGELVGKNLHYSEEDAEYSQYLDYEYNIRGWLRSINESSLSGDTSGSEPADLFSLELIYNTTIPTSPSN
ncbi:DUF6443 domain-containing protein [Ekhidna sp.]|uniref:DUF6443 domain-containing protein n=1 Tax=Ekhidna sp. TaxID=2608089 RepID=UPI003519B6A1